MVTSRKLDLEIASKLIEYKLRYQENKKENSNESE